MNILLPEATTRNPRKHGKVRETRSHLVVNTFTAQFGAQRDILHSKNKGNIPYALQYLQCSCRQHTGSRRSLELIVFSINRSEWLTKEGLYAELLNTLKWNAQLKNVQVPSRTKNFVRFSYLICRPTPPNPIAMRHGITHGERWQMRGEKKVAEDPEGKMPFARRTHKWMENIKVILFLKCKTIWTGLTWFNRNHWRTPFKTVSKRCPENGTLLISFPRRTLFRSHFSVLLDSQ